MGTPKEEATRKVREVKSNLPKKKALCLSKYTPSRLVYDLTRELPYVEELRLESLLPATPAYVELLQELQVKKAKIWRQAKYFHEPGPECIYIRCGNHCERYHILSCSLRTETLTRFCNEVWSTMWLLPLLNTAHCVIFYFHSFRYVDNLELYNSKPSVGGCIFYNKLPNNIIQIENKNQFTRELKKLLIKGFWMKNSQTLATDIYHCLMQLLFFLVFYVYITTCFS
jgi:hypothetical protein